MNSHNQYKSAKEIVDKIRFSFDDKKIQIDESIDLKNILRGHLSNNGLLINSTVTPKLYKSVSNVSKKLSIKQGYIEAYIYPSSELQAISYAGASNRCIIKISSALVDLLNPQEIEFVIGHETGHFLLEHGSIKFNDEEASIEHFMQQRSQEISADRVGLIACGSSKTAIRALMKIISGLGDLHLRYDIRSYLDQLKNTNVNNSGSNGLSTHPPILIRSRALLWFDTSAYITLGKDHQSIKEQKNIDTKIDNDLENFVDGPVRELIDEYKEDASFWKCISNVTEDGLFDKNEQEIVLKKFGKNKLEKVLNFFTGMNSDQAKMMSQERYTTSLKKLKRLIPYSYDKVKKEIEKEIDSIT